MKLYNIVGGANGVGKSSLTGVLCSQTANMGEVIDPDAIAAQYHCSNLEAGKLAIRKIQNCMTNGLSFTQETTLSGNRILRTIKSARMENYRIRLFYVGIQDVEESLARIANRVRKGGHNISQDAVERRYAKRFEDVKRILRFCDEAHFYDNENGFREVGEYKRTMFYQKTGWIPKWYLDLIEFCST